jgi:hypothetical protein
VYERVDAIRGADGPTQRELYNQFDVRVTVAGWSECPTCAGKGKLARKALEPVMLAAYDRMGLVTRGGVVCPTCRAARSVPQLSIVGNLDGFGSIRLRSEVPHVAAA